MYSQSASPAINACFDALKNQLETHGYNVTKDYNSGTTDYRRGFCLKPRSFGKPPLLNSMNAKGSTNVSAKRRKSKYYSPCHNLK